MKMALEEKSARLALPRLRPHSSQYRTAFWHSTIADNNSFEQWHDDGGKDISQRANETWKRMLRDYEAPALDPALDEALQASMAKRKEGLPDSVV